METSSNFIRDVNRFNLPEPPAFWLRALWEFDSSLVVIPSKQQALYRLAQRRKVNLPEKILRDPFFQQSDTQMLASYGLVPVTSILPTINWSDPSNFQELASRAPWRNGGSEEVLRKIEEQEAREELDRTVNQDEHLTSLGRDAWGLYKKKLGLQSHMYIPRRKESIVGGKNPSSPSFRIK